MSPDTVNTYVLYGVYHALYGWVKDAKYGHPRYQKKRPMFCGTHSKALRLMKASKGSKVVAFDVTPIVGSQL